MRKTPLEKRIVRLLWIVKKLYDGEKVYTREIAYKFGITLRSAQRDMVVLERAGLAIYNQPRTTKNLWYWAKVK
jgi:predicted DNA-binding transcriptional regulator YafY